MSMLKKIEAEMVTTRFLYDGSYLIQESDTTGRQISYVLRLTYLFNKVYVCQN